MKSILTTVVLAFSLILVSCGNTSTQDKATPIKDSTCVIKCDSVKAVKVDSVAKTVKADTTSKKKK